MKISEIKNGNMNKVYLLEIEGNKYIIRTSDFDNSFECKVLDLLKKNNLNCPKIITNFKVDNKYIIIYKYLEGNNPVIFDDDFYIELAKGLKELHSITHNFITTDYIHNEENKKKLANYYKNAIESKYISRDKKIIDETYSEVSSLNLDELDKCIIHSDIKKENLIQNKKDIYLIDFGNCYIGSRLIDVIRVIMWFFINKENYDYRRIELFINEYFKNNKPNQVEKNNIDKLFIYCILYNLLKDISLNKDSFATVNLKTNNKVGEDFNEKSISIALLGTTLCPCSKEISKYGAHNQKCKVIITLYGDYENIDFDLLITEIEKQFSANVYSTVKREDEKYITEKAYENPKFSEDLIRDLLINISALYDGKVEAELINYESIHEHNVYAKGTIDTKRKVLKV